MPLDPKQRHRLLMADRTGDVAWIAAVIEKLLAADPTVTLAEVEAAFRDAGGSAYVIAGEPFAVVIGFAAWHSALGRLGMTAETNRAVLAAEPITPPATLPSTRSQLTPGGMDGADLFD